MRFMPDRIPKTIHYFWFGKKPLPESANKCIESWKRFCPDYEIKRWDESNYEINSCNYIIEAYKAGKWAFVSDYARLDILNRFGGLYFDVDVELIKPIDDLVENGPFMCCESSTEANGKIVDIGIALGLGMATYPNMPIIKEILTTFEKDNFYDKGIDNNIVKRVTRLFCDKGFIQNNQLQNIGDMTIYPSEYFCPLDNMTGELEITENTRAIHHYDASWMNKSGRISIEISRKFSKSGKIGHIVGTACSIPFRLVNKIKKV